MAVKVTKPELNLREALNQSLTLEGLENHSVKVKSIDGNLAPTTAAALQCTATSASTTAIKNDNSGYISLTVQNSSDNSWYTISGEQLQIDKSGLVLVTYNQDIISSLSTGYILTYIYVNGTIKTRQLITNTGGEWDCIHNSWTGYCNAGDYIKIWYQTATGDITSMDAGTWSNYSFTWIAQ